MLKSLLTKKIGYNRINKRNQFFLWIVVIYTLVSVSYNTINAQNIQKKDISMGDVLKIARDNSLASFKAKRKYGIGFWAYQSYRARLRPKAELELRPFTYRRSLTKRYDSQQNIDVYRSEESLNSYYNISVTQNILATGGRIYLNSSFNRLANFRDNIIENYNTTPIRIGLNQPLMAFNTLKWEHKIEPLKYEKSKRALLKDLQQINITGVNLFFNWALATKKKEIARDNLSSAEKLFNIGKKRYALGSVERDDILNLELEIYNANTRLTQAQKELERTVSTLKIYLRMEEWNFQLPIFPALISKMKIEVKEALNHAVSHNPDLLDLEIKKISALRDLDKTMKGNRFDISVTASYGLNQQSNTFVTSYQNLLDQQLIAVNLRIPLLDWGERKGNIKIAKMNKEISDIEIEQQKNYLEQQIRLKVTDFNLQEQLVIGATKSMEISKASYEITEKRFLSGSVDLLRLTSSRKAWQLAFENYNMSLFNYWKFYYEVQQLTLYDYHKKISLSADFDQILKNN